VTSGVSVRILRDRRSLPGRKPFLILWIYGLISTKITLPYYLVNPNTIYAYLRKAFKHYILNLFLFLPIRLLTTLSLFDAPTTFKF
jgi:hypothetical protein